MFVEMFDCIVTGCISVFSKYLQSYGRLKCTIYDRQVQAFDVQIPISIKIHITIILR